MSRRFKPVFMTSAVLLYISGVGYVILDKFFQIHGEFGTDHPALQIPLLHVHGTVGLIFLVVFGHLYATHIRPGLRGWRRKWSGNSIFLPLVVLALTVPGLYYFGNENWKNTAAWIHTYLGIAILIPFLVHLYGRHRPPR